MSTQKLGTHVHSNFICNSKKMETTQMFNSQMGKMWYIHRMEYYSAARKNEAHLGGSFGFFHSGHDPSILGVNPHQAPCFLRSPLLPPPLPLLVCLYSLFHTLSVKEIKSQKKKKVKQCLPRAKGFQENRGGVTAKVYSFFLE